MANKLSTIVKYIAIGALMKTLFYHIVAYKCMLRLANHVVAGGKNV